MAGKADVKWTVVESNLGKIAAGMEKTATQIVAKAALDIEANAKQRAPVDTSRLKNSIQAVKISAQHWRVTVGMEYGLYVEFGTARSPAQPYWTPAVNLVIPEFRKAWERIIV